MLKRLERNFRAFDIRFLLQHRQLGKMAREERFKMSLRDAYPIMNEATCNTCFDSHYIYHTAWAARKLKKITPPEHIDISSSLYFVALASAICPMTFLDCRPADLCIDGLQVGACDLCHLGFPDDSVPSISCMHVVEHVGLGRYGDQLDYDGDLKAIDELKRVVRKGGDILFVVPIGKPKIMFNAHRIYSYRQVMDAFKGFELREFYLIPDDGKGYPVENASEGIADGQEYCCGCFWFHKNGDH